MEDNSEMAGIEEVMDDIRHGRVTGYDSADDMFEKLGIWKSAPILCIYNVFCLVLQKNW